MKEPHSEETQRQRPGAILPSRYTHSFPSAPRSCNTHQGSSVEPTSSPYQQRPSLNEPRTSSGDELRLSTSPLYKLSSFRYGSERESPSGVHLNDPARGKELPKTTHIDGKTSDRTFRDRALSQGATLPRLLNKYLSGSVNDLSRGSDDKRRSGERKLPRNTSEGRVTSGVTHRAPNHVPSSTPLISDRWRTLDREDRNSNKHVTGSSVLTPSALYKTRNRWASLDREGRSQNESSTHRTDQISSSGLNAAQPSTTRRFTFEPTKTVTESSFRKREDSSRPASCTPSDQTRRSSVATGGQDREATYSNGRSRGRSSGALSPSSRRLYGSEMNLASIGSRQDPSYMAMTSSRYPSGRNYDQDGTNVTGSKRFQSETLRRSSSPGQNPAQPSGISTPHYGPPITSVQLKLMPHQSNFYSAKSNGQWEDATRSTTDVSSFNHAEPGTESSSGTLRQFNGACDSMEPSVDYTQHGVGSEPMPPLGSTMRATAYPSVETKTQMLDGNRIEDSGMGFSGINIRSSSANPRAEIITDERRLVRGAPVDSMTTSVGSATLNNPSPIVGHSTGVSSSGYSDKYDVKGLRKDEKEEKEENIAKQIFTKEDWISSARRTGKSPTPVENRVMTVLSDDRKTEVHGREANARSSDRSAPPVEWREQLDNMEANTRNDKRAMQNTELSVKENLTSPPRISTAAKWKEFLNGSNETDSSHNDHSYNERRKEGAITIGGNLGYSNGGQWKVDPEWTKEEGSTLQLPVVHKETSRTTRSKMFDADEDIPRRAGNQRKDFIVSEAPLEITSTLEGSSILDRSNMEDGVKHGDEKMEDASQVEAKMNERNMEGSCNGGVVQGLKEVEIFVQRGALGVGFCVEGGLQSTSGDKPITIKRIFAGADGYLRGKLRAGDEILRVNDKDFRQMSHYKAWNFLKTLPEGPAKLLIFSK